ncbi:hypothetical protein K503DRAFT_495007 [Rhizopogon vinicolor AM-OR11-026]|uniref:Uncharacterized protein n=1 Tax=Rhizopogon vinicolor AM-OR11-026 TaxID=1314800 RepID=A0A1B7MMB5_9AGAM|nr:hypothetical protein K503DRAFT_495007 [Rhizopogon vinicolor AM-OR11-026]
MAVTENTARRDTFMRGTEVPVHTQACDEEHALVDERLWEDHTLYLLFFLMYDVGEIADYLIVTLGSYDRKRCRHEHVCGSWRSKCRR